MEVGTTF